MDAEEKHREDEEKAVTSHADPKKIEWKKTPKEKSEKLAGEN